MGVNPPDKRTIFKSVAYLSGGSLHALSVITDRYQAKRLQLVQCHQQYCLRIGRQQAEQAQPSDPKNARNKLQIPPTLTIGQGMPERVIVNRDPTLEPYRPFFING